MAGYIRTGKQKYIDGAKDCACCGRKNDIPSRCLTENYISEYAYQLLFVLDTINCMVQRPTFPDDVVRVVEKEENPSPYGFSILVPTVPGRKIPIIQASFQWVFYGQVHFNKTTTDRLYNLQFESEQPFGSTFQVLGRIDFDHNNESYSLTRTYTYKKGLDDSEKIAEDIALNKMDEDHNWKRIDRPKDTIEKLLPSGLSDYFFFDGESMIGALMCRKTLYHFKN